MNDLLYSLQCDVLDAQFQALKEVIDTSDSFETIRAAHSKFVIYMCMRLCICMYVCMYVYISGDRHTRHLRERERERERESTHAYVCMYVCMYVCISWIDTRDIFECVCVCVYICICR